jgi:hypothetical protein
VAGGRAARRRAGGGELVQTPRAPDPRVAASLAALALAVAVALAGYPPLRAGRLEGVAAAPGLLGVAFVALARAGLVALVPWALALLALDYLLVDLARGEPLLAAAFYGAGLLLLAELVYAARELHRGREERAARRAVRLLALAAAALAAGFVPVVAAGVSSPAGLTAELLALLAGVLMLATPALLVRRRHAAAARRRA